MPRLAWLTDIHLNFLKGQAVYAFFDRIRDSDPDAVLLGGDIGEAHDVAFYLAELADVIQRPIYFVLGNHDFYRGSISAVRSAAGKLAVAQPMLHWLPAAGVVALSPTTALVGHDGWADGRLGDYQRSEILLNDYLLIEELNKHDKAGRLDLLHQLGDEAADHFRKVLPPALASHEHVIVLTHVPPFREACWHEGRISDENWLPHMACKAVGDELRRIMLAYPHRRMTVLCGHTHSPGEATILPNLTVLTGESVYGKPKIQRLLEIP
ncbi:MAG: metallophosphoesterase [Phycisphaeraceae bacterium]